MIKLTLPLFLMIVVFFSGCSKRHHPSMENKTLLLQPGGGAKDDGQDCLVAYREMDDDYYANENHSGNPDIAAIRWTYNADDAGEGTTRTYIKFIGLTQIPSEANIVDARLSLYGVQSSVAAPNVGNSFYPGSPYESYVDNSCWIKLVTGDWDESSITWNNKPGTSETGRAAVPASTSQWNFDAANIDVTEMVTQMVKTGKNYGFCLELQNEQIYRGMIFGSSEHSDSLKRPKLVVNYKIRK